MPDPTGKLRDIVTARLGRCGRCTNTSFLVFAGSAGLTLAMALVGAPAPLFAAALAGALAAGLLWALHVLAFTLRAIDATARRAARPAGALPRPWSRRAVIAAFWRVLIFSAMSASLPRGALGQSCNCYTQSDCHCPPDFPQCIYNPSTGEAICCGENAVGCAGPNYTWCCPPNTRCYGTENQCY